ncbi:hypothetical protein BGZ80_010343, partial [Entomortierella chlamydospora]
QQQQQQHSKQALEHHNSSLDFFSSLDRDVPSLSPKSVSRPSSSSSSSTSSSLSHSGATSHLPPFPPTPSDFSNFSRIGSVNKSASERNLTQGSNNNTAHKEHAPPTSTPFSTFTNPSGPHEFLGSGTLQASSPSSSSMGQRKKNDPLSSMNFGTSTGPALHGSLSVVASPTLATQSGNRTPDLASIMSPAVTPPPPKTAPKLPARILSAPHHPAPLTAQAHDPMQTKNHSQNQSQSQSQNQSQSQSQKQNPQYTTSRHPATAHAPPVPQLEAISQSRSHSPFPQLPSSTATAAPVQPLPVTPQSFWPRDDSDSDDFFQQVQSPPPPEVPIPSSRKPAPNPISEPIPISVPFKPLPKRTEHQREKSSSSKEALRSPSTKENHSNDTSDPPIVLPSSASPPSVTMISYPPPPPSILYTDDQITISSLHLTIHAFYFPLNTPVTIPLLSITDVETLRSADTNGNAGGVAGWFNYKNWGMSAISDIWWARDPTRTATGAITTAGFTSPSSKAAIKENAPPIHVVVRVKGEWLRKGFGVQHEHGVKVLQEAWKNVKESERGLRPLRPATGLFGDEDEDDLTVEENSLGEATNGESEKRRWLNYQNTWTAYPFADDSPLYLAQQQRRGGSLSSTKSNRYHHLQRFRTNNAAGAAGGTMLLREDESCGDDPLFIDNDLNIHEEI